MNNNKPLFHKDGHYCIGGGCICHHCNREILFVGLIKQAGDTPCKLCAIELGLVDQLLPRFCYICKVQTVFYTVTAWKPYPLREIVQGEEHEGKRYSGKALDELIKNNPFQVYCEACTRALIQQAREGNATISDFVATLEALAPLDV